MRSHDYPSRAVQSGAGGTLRDPLDPARTELDDIHWRSDEARDEFGFDETLCGFAPRQGEDLSTFEERQSVESRRHAEHDAGRGFGEGKVSWLDGHHLSRHRRNQIGDD